MSDPAPNGDEWFLDRVRDVLGLDKFKAPEQVLDALRARLEPSSPFAVGDVVRLRSGGPLLTVIGSWPSGTRIAAITEHIGFCDEVPPACLVAAGPEIDAATKLAALRKGLHEALRIVQAAGDAS